MEINTLLERCFVRHGKYCVFKNDICILKAAQNGSFPFVGLISTGKYRGESRKVLILKEPRLKIAFLSSLARASLRIFGY